MKISDAALRRLKAKEKGVFPPETVRAIRKKLGLTQEEAGTLFKLLRGFQRRAFHLSLNSCNADALFTICLQAAAPLHSHAIVKA